MKRLVKFSFKVFSPYGKSCHKLLISIVQKCMVVIQTVLKNESYSAALWQLDKA